MSISGENLGSPKYLARLVVEYFHFRSFPYRVAILAELTEGFRIRNCHFWERVRCNPRTSPRKHERDAFMCSSNILSPRTGVERNEFIMLNATLRYSLLSAVSRSRHCLSVGMGIEATAIATPRQRLTGCSKNLLYICLQSFGPWNTLQQYQSPSMRLHSDCQP